jgi:hypothetical protein
MCLGVPGGEARFRDILTKEPDAVVLPRGLAEKAREDAVRVGFTEKVRYKHCRSIAR